jgi:hypothetical protein
MNKIAYELGRNVVKQAVLSRGELLPSHYAGAGGLVGGLAGGGLGALGGFGLGMMDREATLRTILGTMLTGGALGAAAGAGVGGVAGYGLGSKETATPVQSLMDKLIG